MVPVGDKQWPPVHQGTHLGGRLLVGDDPQAADYPQVVGYDQVGAGQRAEIENGHHLVSLVGIEGEHLAQVHVCGLQQVQSVFLGSAEGLLVRVNGAAAELLQRHPGHESAANERVSVGRELLLVKVKGRAALADQHTAVLPFLQAFGGPSVAVVALGVGLGLLAVDQPHHVVRVQTI